MVRLHLDEYMTELCEERLNDDRTTLMVDLEEYLKEQVAEYLFEIAVNENNLLDDILGGFVSEVDWHCIAADNWDEIKSNW